ncbi:hypothetical protein Tco_1027690 [Tanacetum coccineum]
MSEVGRLEGGEILDSGEYERVHREEILEGRECRDVGEIDETEDDRAWFARYLSELEDSNGVIGERIYAFEGGEGVNYCVGFVIYEPWSYYVFGMRSDIGSERETCWRGCFQRDDGFRYNDPLPCSWLFGYWRVRFFFFFRSVLLFFVSGLLFGLEAMTYYLDLRFVDEDCRVSEARLLKLCEIEMLKMRVLSMNQTSGPEALYFDDPNACINTKVETISSDSYAFADHTLGEQM